MKNFCKSFITVFTENGYHKAMLPSGEVIPHAVKSITVDAVDGSKAKFDFACNIVGTKEEALEQYQKK